MKCGYRRTTEIDLTKKTTRLSWVTSCGRVTRAVGRGWIYCPWCGKIIGKVKG